MQKKMDELEREMRYAAAKRVAEDFKDPLGPLNALTAATLAPPGIHIHAYVHVYMYAGFISTPLAAHPWPHHHPPSTWRHWHLTGV